MKTALRTPTLHLLIRSSSSFLRAMVSASSFPISSLLASWQSASDYQYCEFYTMEKKAKPPLRESDPRSDRQRPITASTLSRRVSKKRKTFGSSSSAYPTHCEEGASREYRITRLAACLALFIYCASACSGRNGNSIADDKSKYSCSRSLKLSSYVSKNNRNSSCEEAEDRGVPRIVRWSQEGTRCPFEARDKVTILLHSYNIQDSLKKSLSQHLKSPSASPVKLVFVDNGSSSNGG
ncbi:hypothetical protein TSAR_003160 [Trichomalopsis sarcophagae]|uniref:Uncharacterized protein n=1 Tax=Trichomalopsis sarcophagae TaxID=543379 RepID=A0A232FA67_9HYME|nr:hypothetical protein TSAR_003160 [Trichomalopsis sarcophagae]